MHKMCTEVNAGLRIHWPQIRFREKMATRVLLRVGKVLQRTNCGRQTNGLNTVVLRLESVCRRFARGDVEIPLEACLSSAELTLVRCAVWLS